MKKNILIIFSLLLSNISLNAQDTLSISKALELGLQNNYSIKIAQNKHQIAKNNNTIGNAGFLPSLNLGGGYTTYLNTIKTEDFNGNTINSDVNSNLLAGNVQLNWVLFDGFKMFIEKNRFQELQNLSELQMLSTIENTIARILVSYYNILLQYQKLKLYEEVLKLSAQRKELALKKFNLGSFSEVAFLQASVDFNSDSIDFVNQQIYLQNAQADFNILIGVEYNKAFRFTDSIKDYTLFTWETVLQQAIAANSDLQMDKSYTNIANLNYRVSNSPMYPKFSFVSAYNYNKYQYDKGTYKFNQTQGPSFGVTLNYALFNGFNNRRNAQNAKLELKSNEIILQQSTEELKSTMFQLYNEYQSSFKNLNFETENVKLAQKNTFIAFEKYKLGQLSDPDFRQIQNAQITSEIRLLSAKFEAKRNEIEILRLTGAFVTQLVKK